jgi:hypothetical protein
VLLLHNFTAVSFASTWPVILIACGACLAFGGFLELGLVCIGSFLIVLLANLRILPGIARSWPFILIWLALVVLIGYLRSRARAELDGSDSSLSLR